MKKMLCLLVCSVLVSTAVADPDGVVKALDTFVPKGALQEEQAFGDYVIRTYRKGSGSFEILRNGERVYAEHGYVFRVGSKYKFGETNSPVSIGTDITGDGQPNLVVSEWTGGAHCCYLFNIFEIGPTFRHIQTINATHSDDAEFRNCDDDPDLEFVMEDWTFAYWDGCFAGSPSPKVILKYNGERYEIATELMRKPPMTEEKLAELAHETRISSSWRVRGEPDEGWYDKPSSDVWEQMLDLIYSGNLDQAWDFFYLAWNHDWERDMKQKTNDTFLRAFMKQLKMSPFWDDVRKMSGY